MAFSLPRRTAGLEPCRLTALIRRRLTHSEYTKSSRDTEGLQGWYQTETLPRSLALFHSFSLETSKHIQSYSGDEIKTASHFALTCTICLGFRCPTFPRMPFSVFQGEWTLLTYVCMHVCRLFCHLYICICTNTDTCWGSSCLCKFNIPLYCIVKYCIISSSFFQAYSSMYLNFPSRKLRRHDYNN